MARVDGAATSSLCVIFRDFYACESFKHGCLGSWPRQRTIEGIGHYRHRRCSTWSSTDLSIWCYGCSSYKYFGQPPFNDALHTNYSNGSDGRTSVVTNCKRRIVYWLFLCNQKYFAY